MLARPVHRRNHEYWGSAGGLRVEYIQPGEVGYEQYGEYRMRWKKAKGVYPPSH